MGMFVRAGPLAFALCASAIAARAGEGRDEALKRASDATGAASATLEAGALWRDGQAAVHDFSAGMAEATQGPYAHLDEIEAAAEGARRDATRLRGYGAAIGVAGTAATAIRTGAAAKECWDTPPEQRDATHGGCGRLLDACLDLALDVAGRACAPVAAAQILDSMVDSGYRWVDPESRTAHEAFVQDVVPMAISWFDDDFVYSDELGQSATQQAAQQAKRNAVRQRQLDAQARAYAYEQRRIAERASMAAAPPAPDPFLTALLDAQRRAAAEERASPRNAPVPNPTGGAPATVGKPPNPTAGSPTYEYHCPHGETCGVR